MSLINPNINIYSFGKHEAIFSTLDKSNACLMINEAIGAGKSAQDVADKINKLYGEGYAYVFPVIHHTDEIKPQFLNIKN